MFGRIIRWNDPLGQGMIGSTDGTFALRRENCSPAVQSELAGDAIPPGTPLPVTFQVDPIAGEAVNVDLAASEDLAAAEPAMAPVTSITEAQSMPRRTVKKTAARKVARNTTAHKTKSRSTLRKNSPARKKMPARRRKSARKQASPRRSKN